MSAHSVTVKRADEVQVGDRINRNGIAREVIGWSHHHGGVYLILCGEGDTSGVEVAYRPDVLVEVMNK